MIKQNPNQSPIENEVRITDIETFTYAFKLGAKIMIDVLTEGQMKEI